MEKEQIIQRLKTETGTKISDWFEKSDRRIFAEVEPRDIPAVSRLLFRELGARFQIASGIDTPTSIEILYHWAFDEHGFVVTLKTRLDRDAPEIESLTNICKGTEWIEREIWELLGVNFKNHPDMRHLLLKDDWPEGQYPLRRDYHPSEKSAATEEKKHDETHSHSDWSLSCTPGGAGVF